MTTHRGTIDAQWSKKRVLQHTLRMWIIYFDSKFPSESSTLLSPCEHVETDEVFITLQFSQTTEKDLYAGVGGRGDCRPPIIQLYQEQNAGTRRVHVCVATAGVGGLHRHFVVRANLERIKAEQWVVQWKAPRINADYCSCLFSLKLAPLLSSVVT